MWKDKFMPVGIASYVLQFDPDISKQEGYSVDLKANSFENKLHHTFNAAGLNDLGSLSGFLYIHVNNTQEHPTKKLILASIIYKDLETPLNLALETPIFTNQNRGYIKPLNDWNNPDFFIAAFSTLFF